MFAVVDIAGQQFKVEQGQKLYVNYFKDAQENDELTFDKVLLVGGDDNVRIGEPTIEGASVRAKVLDHVKGDKVIVFKKKRRKGYRTKNGHRQQYTKIEIDSITI